jgi:hypothetical protein
LPRTARPGRALSVSRWPNAVTARSPTRWPVLAGSELPRTSIVMTIWSSRRPQRSPVHPRRLRRGLGLPNNAPSAADRVRTYQCLVQGRPHAQSVAGSRGQFRYPEPSTARRRLAPGSEPTRSRRVSTCASLLHNCCRARSRDLARRRFQPTARERKGARRVAGTGRGPASACQSPTLHPARQQSNPLAQMDFGGARQLWPHGASRQRTANVVACGYKCDWA